MIQAECAASAKAANSAVYNEVQINEYILRAEEREKYDSMDKQKEEFATQSAHLKLTEPQINNDKVINLEMTEDRMRINIESENQRLIMKNEPKSFNFIVERNAELNISGLNQGGKA